MYVEGVLLQIQRAARSANGYSTLLAFTDSNLMVMKDKVTGTSAGILLIENKVKRKMECLWEECKD